MSEHSHTMCAHRHTNTPPHTGIHCPCCTNRRNRPRSHRQLLFFSFLVHRLIRSLLWRARTNVLKLKLAGKQGWRSSRNVRNNVPVCVYEALCTMQLTVFITVWFNRPTWLVDEAIHLVSSRRSVGTVQICLILGVVVLIKEFLIGAQSACTHHCAGSRTI